jgi:outer membrane protein OmpA-like peptidoglycan-associated protein
MRRDLAILAGTTALAAVLVVATRTAESDRTAVSPDTTKVAAVEDAPVQPAQPEAVESHPEPPPAAVAVAELEAEIARLQDELEERTVELATLRTTLSERDAALADRDTELTARDTELEELRAELAGLRERFAFETKLAALTTGTDPADPTATVVEAAAPAPALSANAPLTAIHFDPGSARLTPGGQVHAAAAAVMLADMPLDRVRVNGYADRTGDPARNQTLAEARARAVADFLVANGVPAASIETAGMIAADTLPVATDAGVAEPLNRAATITALPPPIT